MQADDSLLWRGERDGRGASYEERGGWFKENVWLRHLAARFWGLR